MHLLYVLLTLYDDNMIISNDYKLIYNEETVCGTSLANKVIFKDKFVSTINSADSCSILF